MHNCPAAPVILVGTKIDLRETQQFRHQAISTEQGQKLCKEIDAACYCECSALTQDGLKEGIKYVALSFNPNNTL